MSNAEIGWLITAAIVVALLCERKRTVQHDQSINDAVSDLRIKVRDILIAEFGESYHELFWHVGYVFNRKRPWFIKISRPDVNSRWSGETVDECLKKFREGKGASVRSEQQ